MKGIIEIGIIEGRRGFLGFGYFFWGGGWGVLFLVLKGLVFVFLF